MSTVNTNPEANVQEYVWANRMSDSGLESLQGFKVQALDGEAGRVEQVLYWSDTARPDYIVVGSGRWFFGHKSVLSVMVIEDVDISARKVMIGLSCEQVRSAPEFLPPL